MGMQTGTTLMEGIMAAFKKTTPAFTFCPGHTISRSLSYSYISSNVKVYLHKDIYCSIFFPVI